MPQPQSTSTVKGTPSGPILDVRHVFLSASHLKDRRYGHDSITTAHARRHAAAWSRPQNPTSLYPRGTAAGRVLRQIPRPDHRRRTPPLFPLSHHREAPRPLDHNRDPLGAQILVRAHPAPALPDSRPPPSAPSAGTAGGVEC